LEVLRLVEDDTAALRDRIQSEFNAKAQSRQDATRGFYYETRKPRIIEKISWFPGFLMELFLVPPLRLGVFALKVFCMMAVCKVWPAARTGAKGQRPTQGRAGAGLASPAAQSNPFASRDLPVNLVMQT
jgi:hypothetical protein